MTDATDLLASLNLYPFDASSNPGGLAAGGYLAELGGVSLVARSVRAWGAVTHQLLASRRLAQSMARQSEAGVSNLIASPHAEAGGAPPSSQAVRTLERSWTGDACWKIQNPTGAGAYPDIFEIDLPEGASVITVALWMYNGSTFPVQVGFAGSGGWGLETIPVGEWTLYAKTLTVRANPAKFEARLAFGGVPGALDGDLFFDDLLCVVGSHVGSDLVSSTDGGLNEPLPAALAFAQSSRGACEAAKIAANGSRAEAVEAVALTLSERDQAIAALDGTEAANAAAFSALRQITELKARWI